MASSKKEYQTWDLPKSVYTVHLRPISREKAFDASLSGSGLNEGIESEVTYRILPGQELTQRKRHLLKFNLLGD